MKAEYIILYLRGINRQIIFEEDEDTIRFLDILREFKEKMGTSYSLLFEGKSYIFVPQGKTKK
ncbi:MAG: hypothetical protein ACOYJ1_06215 [Peptococcales bacterium]